MRRRYDRAPQVLYSHRVPPAELRDSDASVGDNKAYITFGEFPQNRVILSSPLHVPYFQHEFLLFKIVILHRWSTIVTRVCMSECPHFGQFNR